MAEHPRIEELRRRVLKDKASIAFAQLAEEYRRAGRFEEAIETCRVGLSHHPGYLSAHVTLGRALIEVGQWQQAHDELQRVLSAAPENLAALKGLAEIHHRQGDQRQALDYYRRALELAPHDPELEHLVVQISRELEASSPVAAVADGMSFEEAMGEFLALDQAASKEPSSGSAEPSFDLATELIPAASEPLIPSAEPALPAPAVVSVVPVAPGLEEPESVPPESLTVTADVDSLPPDSPPESPSPAKATMQVEALERWLDAILADRQKEQPPTGGQA